MKTTSAQFDSRPQLNDGMRDVAFDRAVAMLPPAYRWVMMLAVDERLTPQEIADLASIDLGVVADVLARGQVLAQQIKNRLIAGY